MIREYIKLCNNSSKRWYVKINLRDRGSIMGNCSGTKKLLK